MTKTVTISMRPVPVSSLNEYINNSRTHTEAQIEKIAQAIAEFGFLNPIVIDETNTIIAGHARVRAAKKLGITEVPAVLADHLNEAQRRAYVIADNRLSEDAGWNQAMLRTELHFLKDAGFNVRLTGMGDDELRKLVHLSDAFAPALQPTQGSSAFTPQETQRAGDKLQGHYEHAGKQELVPVTCPHCGHDFSIQAADLTGENLQ